MPLGFGFKFGLGGGGSAASFIKWLLPFNLGLSATIGDDAVSGGTSPTEARVWDATLGLVIQEVSAGSPVSEGMRLSYDTDEGATLGPEIVVNGDFATQDAWFIDPSWTISGGTANGDGEIGRIFQPIDELEAGGSGIGTPVFVEYDVVEYVNGGITIDCYGVLLPTVTAVGHYSGFGITTSTLNLYVNNSGKFFTGKIDNVSVKVVSPVFLNSVSSVDATKLTPSKTGSDGNEIKLVFDAWVDATVYAAGAYVVDFVGVQAKYYSTVAGGTSSGTGVADDTGVTWVLEGNYSNLGGGTLTRVLSEPAASNLFLVPETPATQNITTTAQNYTVSVWGTGSITLSGTATGVATQGNPLTVTATAGTLTCTVAGSLSWGQVETGDVNTTFTDGTRDATDFSSARVITEQFLRVRVADIQSQTYLSDGTNTLAYDLATTTLTFTDGTTTLTYVGALTVGDTIFIDQVDGKLYVEEDLKDTDGALDPLPWGAITSIGNVTDIYESSDLDPTDATWDE